MYLALYPPDHPLLSAPSYWAMKYAPLASLRPEDLKKIYSLSPIHRMAHRLIQPNLEVLDAGCGIGVLSLLNEDPSVRMIGIDFSPEQIEKAKNLSPKTRFEIGPITRLPFPDESFDLYIAISSLEVIPEGLIPPLQEAYRVLKKGGCLFIACQRLQSDTFLKRPLRAFSTVGQFDLKKIDGVVSPFPQNAFGYYYSLKELKKAAQQCGFEKVRGIRSDVAGGMSYSFLLGSFFRDRLASLIQRLVTQQSDHLSWGMRLGRSFLLEEGNRWISPLRALWSYWNGVSAVKPE